MSNQKSASNFKRRAISLFKYVLILTCISMVVDLWRSQSIPSHEPFDLTAQTVQGDWVEIEALSQAQPVVVYFWATWCSVCQFVTPSVNWISHYYPTVGVSISSGEDRKVARYLEHKNSELKTINDSTGQISQQWGVRATPTIFIVDKGEITYITTGFTSPIGILARVWLS